MRRRLCVAVRRPLVAAKQIARVRSLIRDAEIEGLMRLYTRPIFKAAGLNPSAGACLSHQRSSINAFVAGGQRIFIHTGLLTQAKTPNEVIGVLAHETGHIAGGHLARMQNELDRKSSTLRLSACCWVRLPWRAGRRRARAKSRRRDGGIMMGSQGMAQRSCS